MEVKFFKRQADLRKWFEKNHDKLTEQWIGFNKKSSGQPSITWPESVDEVLCFGWIDGVRKTIDDLSYKIRFTPRKQKSTWSALNIKRVGELQTSGLMLKPGLDAFERREETRSRIYAYERESVSLRPDLEKKFRKNKTAWEFFESQPPSYKKPALWWVMSAKQEETRQRRIETLINDSEAGLRLAQHRRSPK